MCCITVASEQAFGIFCFCGGYVGSREAFVERLLDTLQAESQGAERIDPPCVAPRSQNLE